MAAITFETFVIPSQNLQKSFLTICLNLIRLPENSVGLQLKQCFYYRLINHHLKIYFLSGQEALKTIEGASFVLQCFKQMLLD